MPEGGKIFEYTLQSQSKPGWLGLKLAWSALFALYPYCLEQCLAYNC